MKGKWPREVSAGGIVKRGGEVLLIKVTNLLGKEVWTFPKGHLEAGETAEEAAVREVKEETGWDCRITRSLGEVNYKFKRDGRLIDKTVVWFLMETVGETGIPDAQEVMECRWLKTAEAEALLTYPSDKTLAGRLKKAASPPRSRGRRRP
jgi:ADP-ribose pyrophosphatase YjhB (NUDIX family)